MTVDSEKVKRRVKYFGYCVTCRHSPRNHLDEMCVVKGCGCEEFVAHGIQRESIADALENDRCGICGSVEHFREDHPH